MREKEATMDLQEELIALGRKSKTFGDKLQTEEATKNTLIMPFIKLLGYDPFDPTEVVPEYATALGDYKDSRVDYAILKDGRSIIIIECKAYGTPLDASKCSQLLHYFTGADAKVAILTDGNSYQFFSDLDTPNIMDQKPYMEFELENFNPALIPELKKLVKTNFDESQVLSSASTLKYTNEFKRVIDAQLQDPEDDFVRFFVSRCYGGKITASVKERFAPILKDALNLYIRERINERLKSAIDAPQSGDASASTAPTTATQTTAGADGSESESGDAANVIVTSEEEKQAFYIVKSLLLGHCDPEKIILRDFKGLCNICYESASKVIVHLYFNKKPFKLGLRSTSSTDDRAVNKVAIEKVDDMYNFAQQLKERVKLFQTLQAQAQATSESSTDTVAD